MPWTKILLDWTLDIAGDLISQTWIIQWNLDLTNLYLTKSSIWRTILYVPAKVTNSKMYGIEPRYNEPQYNITNIIQKPKHKIYFDITNYNFKTRQKINVNCCWLLFSSMYHFLFKFCYALNANCVLRNWRNSWLSLIRYVWTVNAFGKGTNIKARTFKSLKSGNVG